MIVVLIDVKKKLKKNCVIKRKIVNKVFVIYNKFYILYII